MTAGLSAAAREIILALADDELMMGHRHSEWLGWSPFLEEDLAFASIAQDELGHARALYGLVTDDIDALAFGRSAAEYRSSHLVELPGTPWEHAIARHALYDTAEHVRWRALAESSLRDANGVAAKALAEERYHTDHAVPVLLRLLTGTEESRARTLGALEVLFPFALGLFEPTLAEADAVAEGFTTATSKDLADEWRQALVPILDAAGVRLDLQQEPAGTGGRQGVRSEHFAELHASMTAVFALDPNANW